MTSTPHPVTSPYAGSYADDEDDYSHSRLSSRDHSPPAPLVPRYAEEDTRPTSPRELRGFYAYSWASEVFVVCGMGSFIPITLEQLAREKGHLLGHPHRSCVNGPPSDVGGRDPTSCVLPIWRFEVNTASFAMYTFSISVLAQFIVIVSMSGAADHGRYRKHLLLLFALTGAVATMLFVPIRSSAVLVAAFLAIIANTCFGASSVLLNSFLPLLVRYHPSISAHYHVPKPDDDSLSSPELSLATHISATGTGIGYLSSLILQILAIYLIYLTHSTLFSLRLVLFFIGLWWFLFTLPVIPWLRSRPGPPLSLPPTVGRVRTAVAYLTYSWSSLYKTLMRARKLRDVLTFLAAWFLLSDALATVSGTAVLFAKTTLRMSPAGLAMIAVVVTLSGILGAALWPQLSRIMHLTPMQTISLNILLFLLIPLYGLLPYLPIVRRMGYLGLQSPWEMYPVSVLYGFILGGFSSFCRALFGELVPPGFEAAFYALYAVTDKGSSVIGPLVVGAITDATGEIRPAFFFLAVLVAAPFPILLMVDLERGRREGDALSRELRGLGDGEDSGEQTEGDEVVDEYSRLISQEDEIQRGRRL